MKLLSNRDKALSWGGIFVFLSLMMLLVSCKNDPVSSEPEKIEGEKALITLKIPNYNGGGAQFGSRAFNPDEEGYMSNLYVIAVKYADIDDNGKIQERDAENRIVYTFALNPVGEEFDKGKDENKNDEYEDTELDYHTFNVALYPGKYKFGVLANVDLYLWRAQKISDFTKEDDLNNLVLYFSESNPLVPYHLPMACLPDKIKYSDNTHSEKTSVSNEKDNLITISKNSGTQIYADMTFLCSKVRYTILFDKTEGGISEAFGSSWIRFNVDELNNPIATNLRSWTVLIPRPNGEANPEIKVANPFITRSGSSSVSSEDEEKKPDGYTGSSYQAQMGWWSMNIGRYYWHKEEKECYPKKPNSTLMPWDKSTNEWIESEKKVWQGIVYLPENLNDQILKREIGKTVLEFPYHTRDNSLDDTPEKPADFPKQIYLFGNPNEEQFQGTTDSGEYANNEANFEGIERNYMYDVVAKVVNPDVDELDIRVFVSILPWHDVDQNIPNQGDLYNPGEQDLNGNIGVNDWKGESVNDTW